MARRSLVSLFIVLVCCTTWIARSHAQQTPVDLAFQFIEYASAAFCDEDIVLRWTCDAPSCPFKFTAGTNATAFLTTIKSGTNAYVAYNERLRLIVAAFRGTDNTRNLIQDIRFLKTKPDYNGVPDDALVHKGFYYAWKNTADKVVNEIIRLQRIYPTFRVATAGHSFGSALALHASAELNSRGINATAYTYGQPRVGNEAFSRWYTSLDPQALRVTAYNDIFPQLPPRALDYHHQITELWTNQQGDLVLCSSTNGEDPTCSNSVPFADLSSDAHWPYLGLTFGECYLQ